MKMPVASDMTGLAEFIVARIHTFHASDTFQILRVTGGHPTQADQQSERFPGAVFLSCFTSKPWKWMPWMEAARHTSMGMLLEFIGCNVMPMI